MNLEEIKHWADNPNYTDDELEKMMENDHYVSIDHKDEMILASEVKYGREAVKWLIADNEKLAHAQKKLVEYVGEMEEEAGKMRQENQKLIARVEELESQIPKRTWGPIFD